MGPGALAHPLPPPVPGRGRLAPDRHPRMRTRATRRQVTLYLGPGRALRGAKYCGETNVRDPTLRASGPSWLNLFARWASIGPAGQRPCFIVSGLCRGPASKTNVTVARVGHIDRRAQSRARCFGVSDQLRNGTDRADNRHTSPTTDDVKLPADTRSGECRMRVQRERTHQSTGLRWTYALDADLGIKHVMPHTRVFDDQQRGTPSARTSKPVMFPPRADGSRRSSLPRCWSARTVTPPRRWAGTGGARPARRGILVRHPGRRASPLSHFVKRRFRLGR